MTNESLLRENVSELEYSFSDNTPVSIFENLTVTFESVKSPFGDNFFTRVKIEFIDEDFDESFSPEQSLDLSIDPSSTIDLDVNVKTSSVAFSKTLSLEQREALIKSLQKERPANLERASLVVKEFSNNI